MTLVLNDAEVAARILDHAANGTTDLGADVWREPVANYRSPDRLRAEIERVLRATSVPFCPSAALPEIGSFVARDAAGIPVLVVRGRDGIARAFQNVCRHRGMTIAAGSGCAKVFTCGYHGWAYGLDGKLNHVPDDYGFPGLDKATHGLVPIGCRERFGLVFVNTSVRGETCEVDELPQLIGDDQILLSSSERVTDANWKLVLEGLIEGYHIKATHPESFYPYGYDNLNVVETFGRHSRVTYPFRRIEKLRDVPPAERRVSGLLTYVYHVFPNAFITVLSSHTNLVVLEPIDVAHTRTVNYTLTNAGAGGGDPESAIAAAKKDSAFVGGTGVAEDRAVVESIQRGLGSSANDVFTFGKFESAIVHFHRTLDAALAA